MILQAPYRPRRPLPAPGFPVPSPVQEPFSYEVEGQLFHDGEPIPITHLVAPAGELPVRSLERIAVTVRDDYRPLVSTAVVSPAAGTYPMNGRRSLTS